MKIARPLRSEGTLGAAPEDVARRPGEPWPPVLIAVPPPARPGTRPKRPREEGHDDDAAAAPPGKRPRPRPHHYELLRADWASFYGAECRRSSAAAWCQSIEGPFTLAEWLPVAVYVVRPGSRFYHGTCAEAATPAMVLGHTNWFGGTSTACMYAAQRRDILRTSPAVQACGLPCVTPVVYEFELDVRRRPLLVLAVDRCQTIRALLSLHPAFNDVYETAGTVPPPPPTCGHAGVAGMVGEVGNRGGCRGGSHSPPRTGSV